MKYWEFLIQKEGDQTWLPLETQQVEILEGRYRVVAHTDRVNTPLEIRVSQLMTHEMPPRKRVRKRTSQTNETGLVVVMPYVHLKPGQWSLQCSSLNVMDSLIGEGWQYGVQLDVFAHTEEDWSSEWPIPTDSETVASLIPDHKESSQVVSDPSAPLINQDLPLIQAKAELAHQLNTQNLKTQDRPQDQNPDQQQRTAHATAGTNGSASQDADLTLAHQPYQVLLRQQAYLAQPNKAMVIMGKVKALSDAVYEETSQLWIRLQNPENTQVLMEAHRPLSLARLPADFKVQIQLPAEVTTRVILGEVSLRTAAVDPDTPAKMLASTAFTITAGIAQLLDAVVSQTLSPFEEEASVVLKPTHSADSPAKNGASPYLAVPSLDFTSKGLVPAVGVILPPQLDRDVPRRLDDQPLQAKQPTLPRPEKSTPQIPSISQNTIPTESAEANTAGSQHQSAQSTVPLNPPPSHPPQLPAEMRPKPISHPPMVSQPAQFIGTSILDGDLEADEIAAVLEDIDKDLSSDYSDLDALEAPGIEGVLPTVSSAQKANQSQIAHPTAQSSESSQKQSTRQIEANLDFQALKLKDHFWKKLSTLTHESHEEAAQLANNMKAAGVHRRGTLLPSAPVVPLDNDEIVIYDQPDKKPAVTAPSLPMERGAAQSHLIPANSTQPNSTRPNSTRPNSTRPNSTQPNSAQPNSIQFKSTQPNSASPRGRRHLGLGHRQGTIAPSGSSSGFKSSIAQPQQDTSNETLPEMVMPVISVPRGDLIAGETVTITVRTRPSTYKPFIKLWMIDRQSRSLVIEPQLMTNLLPDALGDLQGTAQLKVPMDCLDVQIAAIAVDMATQQESGKAVVNRHVIPANQVPSKRKGR